jgi:lipoprotein-anchoring transpeptidase ErfK/SrfK
VAAVNTIFRFGLLASLAAVSCLALSFAISGPAATGPLQGEQPANTEEPAPPEAPLFFVISLSKQQVSVYSPKGLYSQSPVSTGQPGHPTPTGIFTILGKELYHESNIYSGAPIRIVANSQQLSVGYCLQIG